MQGNKTMIRKHRPLCMKFGFGIMQKLRLTVQRQKIQRKTKEEMEKPDEERLTTSGQKGRRCIHMVDNSNWEKPNQQNNIIK